MEFGMRHPVVGSAALIHAGDVIREELAMMDSAIRRDDYQDTLACIERAENFFDSLKLLAQNSIFIVRGPAEVVNLTDYRK